MAPAASPLPSMLATPTNPSPAVSMALIVATAVILTEGVGLPTATL